jgi:anti-sigma B factor antagonist
MQHMEGNCQTWSQSDNFTVLTICKESKLKLNLETRNRDGVLIVHGHGRIVYRDEAAALARLMGEVLEQSQRVILDLTGVTAMDSAGIGELALVQSRAQEKNVTLKCAGANVRVLNLLQITRLDSVLEIYDTLDEALASYQTPPYERERAWADC